MAIGDLPQFIDSGHQHTIYGLGNLASGHSVAGTTSNVNFMAQNQLGLLGVGARQFKPEARNVLETKVARMLAGEPQELNLDQKKENRVARRLVQVFIADPNENVPLEDSLLYSGEQKLTDATDQELFFEIDMKTILAAHNEKRVKIVDKKVKDRTEYLEPVKIRDLKMVVVTVAGF